MIRIICKEVYGSPEGASIGTTYRTFDVEAAELERFLLERPGYVMRSVVGAEVLEQK